MYIFENGNLKPLGYFDVDVVKVLFLTFSSIHQIEYSNA